MRKKEEKNNTGSIVCFGGALKSLLLIVPGAALSLSQTITQVSRVHSIQQDGGFKEAAFLPPSSMSVKLADLHSC